MTHAMPCGSLASGHVSPLTTHPGNVSPDREVSDRQARYAEGEHDRREATRVRWMAGFGITVAPRPRNRMKDSTSGDPTQGGNA